MIGIIGDARRNGHGSLANLIAYCEKDGRAAYTGTQNIHFAEHAASEIASLAFQNSRCKEPLMHIILSWREMELPTDSQVDEAVKIALKELDLQDRQAVWIVHADTENRHVHIAVNRIDPETHKAIQPAANWTHKAIQRAARKIELAQGGEVETHGSYKVTDNGALIEKDLPGSDSPKLSKAALDVEAHTVARSAERICHETAAAIIRDAKSWNELHTELAEQGISFDRKGSGAVLSVNGVVVKASTAGQDLSLSKLEARLGVFQPRPENLPLYIIYIRQTEPIERIVKRKVKSNWERYTAASEEYFKEKQEAAAALTERQKAERAALQSRQRKEREHLIASRSWKSMGARLNRERNIIATAQKSTTLDLRDRHSLKRAEMKKRFPERFPNFKKWLELEKSPEAAVSFRYSDNAVTWSGTGETTASNNTQFDIRAFTPVVWNKDGVACAETDGAQ